MSFEEKSQLAYEAYQSGDLAQAEQLCRELVEEYPDNLELLSNLGFILISSGKLDDAYACYRKAVHIRPDYLDGYYNLGIISQQKNEIDKAIFFYVKALEIDPDFLDANVNLGFIHQIRGNFEDAVQWYTGASLLAPDNADILFNLGTCLQKSGKSEEAVTCFRKALLLRQDDAELYNNFGIALQDNFMLDEAITNYKKAIELKPHFPEAYFNLGTALKEDDKGEDSLSAYDSALALNPNYTLARWARCTAHLPFIYTDQESILNARKKYSDELAALNKWISLETRNEIEAAASAVGSQQPFLLACQGMNDRELQKTYGELAVRIMKARYPEFLHQLTVAAPAEGEKIRVGIVSAFFYRHSVWKSPISGWVENLDRERFSLHGYHTGTIKDTETEKAKKCFSRFVEDVHTCEDLCRTIREDNLHVIIYPEIGMDPLTAKLAALRLAPVQCTSLGHPDTSGLPTIDYYLSSNLMEPPDADSHYTEHLVRLPNLGFSYTPLEVPRTSITREFFELPRDSVLYLCSHALFTFLPQHDEIFPRIAQEVPNSKFIFISHPKGTGVTENFRKRIHQSFSQFNLNADNHVVFLPPLDAGKYHAINCISDVFLDSIGWSSYNSALEALACDLPVLTLPGTLMRQRHSTAILNMMGITETIASNTYEYTSMAVRLGKDIEWRRSLSQKIAADKHKLYGDRECIAGLEDFLIKAAKG